MSYRSVDFDAVAPLLPGDKVASRVTSKGEHFHWEPESTSLHSPDPIPFRMPDKEEITKDSFVDLTGSKIGRLTVLGIAASIPSRGNGQRWIVRCVCGSYETRKSKFIKSCLGGRNPGDHEPMCQSCAYTRRLQMGMCNPRKAAAAAKAIMEAAR